MIGFVVDCLCVAFIAILAIFELPSGAVSELVCMAFEFIDAQHGGE